MRSLEGLLGFTRAGTIEGLDQLCLSLNCSVQRRTPVMVRACAPVMMREASRSVSADRDMMSMLTTGLRGIMNFVSIDAVVIGAIVF